MRASAGSSWPTPSSSSGSTARAHSCSATRSARRTPRASGPPTSTSPAAGRPPSTSSTCATGPPARAGTSRRRRRRSPTTWSRRPASATCAPTSCWRASRSPPGWSGWAPGGEGARPDPAEGGHPRPTGPDRGARAAGAGLRGGEQRPRRPPRRAGRRGPLAAGCDVRAAPDEPAHRGLRDPVARGRRQMKIGVVRFPGSCDEVDALQAAERVGDAELLWYADRDLRGADAIIVPGGFSYGDYLRVGAICNGFQVLCEAGLLPGALLPNTSLRFLCRQVSVTVASTGTAWTGECGLGEDLSIQVKHTTGRYYAPEPVLDELADLGQVTFRYAPGQNPNGSVRDIAGVSNKAGNVVGLMPHPEHAVDPLTGSEDGLKLFRSVVGAAAALAA